MSLPYTYSGNFVAYTSARAEALAAEFTSVQNGFSTLATGGVDTGAANAYVVTTPGAPTAAYADGNQVTFKAVNANTGASTINVNGIGAINLLRWSGAALQSGDIPAGVWVYAVYNSTLGGWTVLAPTAPTSTTSSPVSNAVPAHKVGLTAVAGASPYAAAYDATYALDQSISPTWTGQHTFQLTTSGAVGPSIDTVIEATSAGGLLLNNQSANNANIIGILINFDGSGILSIRDVTNAVTLAKFTPNGGLQVGAPTGGDKGAGTINCTGLYVNGTAVTVP